MTATEARAEALKNKKDIYDSTEVAFIAEIEEDIKTAVKYGLFDVNVGRMTANARTYYEGLGYKVILNTISW